MRDTGRQGGQHLILMNDFGVLRGIEQIRLVVVELHLEQPSLAVRVVVDHAGVVGGGGVHIPNGSRHG